MLAYAAFSINSGLVYGALVLMGFFNGFALVGILTSSMEFTTEEERGAYIGLWGLAIAFATGVASIVAGQLVTSLIESGLMKATNGFSLIFTLEGAVTLVSLWFLWNTDHVTFTRKISRRGLSSAMEQDVA
jgi:BCD family chlorophyll transporter-like MFS transporter